MRVLFFFNSLSCCLAIVVNGGILYNDTVSSALYVDIREMVFSKFQLDMSDLVVYAFYYRISTFSM
jgi:hypothetical protein